MQSGKLTDDTTNRSGNIVTPTDSVMTVEPSALGKCSCGGWLLLAGTSVIGPNNYVVRRRCVTCGVWFIEQTIPDLTR